jgi:hypothetical protein
MCMNDNKQRDSYTRSVTVSLFVTNPFRDELL